MSGPLQCEPHGANRRRGRPATCCDDRARSDSQPGRDAPSEDRHNNVRSAIKAAALLSMEKHMRRIMGYQQLSILCRLHSHLESSCSQKIHRRPLAQTHLRTYAICMRRPTSISQEGRPSLPSGLGRTEQVVFLSRTGPVREGKGPATGIRPTAAERLRSR